MKNAVALENIRSVYNVGNIIRTADAFDFDVILLGYSPGIENKKLLKTSLGAEKNVNLKQFYNVKTGIKYIKKNYKTMIACEIIDNAVSIYDLKKNNIEKPICMIFGNEITGVSLETLEFVDFVSFIPMEGIKESINVCETASIFMYEIKRT